MKHVGKTLCVCCLAILIAGWGVGQWRARSIDAAMRNRLLRQAAHIAGTLNPEMVGELSFTPADEGTPAFEFLGSQLTALGKCFPHRGIYTMALREGRLVFGPEDYAEGDPMASPPGTVYEKPAADDMRVFAERRALVFGPTTDEYGTFVCALAPVCDPDNGAVLMAVGIDTLAEDWNALVAAGRRRCLLGSLTAVAVLLGGAGVGSWTRRRRTSRANPKAGATGRPRRRAAILAAGRHADAGLLIGMGVLAVGFLAVVLGETWHWTRTHIDLTANQQARLAVEFDKALRDYVGKSIRPEMEKRVGSHEFIPEAMSTSFVARSVFDRVRAAFPSTVLRFPSTNPRNPANRATPAEESLIQYFEQHPESDSWSGMLEFFEEGERYFVWALPRRFDAGCLQCHGRPEEAPASLLERYGPVAGFGRSVGEVSIDLAAVPVSAAYAKAGARVWRHMLSALVLCVLFLGGIAFLLWADATRRRRAEMAIEGERRFLRLVIDSIPDFVFVKAEDGRYVIANEALAKAYGTTVQELEGKMDSDFSPSPEQVDSYRRDDLEVVATRKKKVIPEECLTYADGAIHWLTTVKVPLIDEDGGCRQLLAVATDITDRKQVEQRQTELLHRLADINQELKDFAYVVSHDLKAPLRAIRTIVDWLRDDYGDKFDEQGREHLALLVSRAGRMQALIDGVLQYSRIGRIEETTVPVDLSRLLPEIIDSLDVPERISVDVQADLPTIEADQTRIVQVFQNLLSNAIKYMDKPQGRIAVACTEEDGFWRFCVTDNGPGIEERHFDRIFKLFQTLSPPDDQESTGVGLALVKRIVEMYGGRIWVESEVGKGSNFLLTLAQRERARCADAFAASPPRASGDRVGDEMEGNCDRNGCGRKAYVL